MGFFNGMKSVNNINNLLKDLENQVTITQDWVQRGAPKTSLENSVNVLSRIHQELIDTFSGSSTARVSMYTLFGEKMRMDGILQYSKNVIMNLKSIIG